MTEYPPIWVGASYQTGGVFRRRLLLVGESTYPAPGDDTWLYNIRIPTEHMDGNCRDGFRTRLVRALLGTSDETPAQIQSTWNSVAFFNYITTPLSGPNQAPREDDWEHHHQPLQERLDYLKPNIVLVLSFRLWDRLTGQSVLTGRVGPTIAAAGRPATLAVAVGENQFAVAYGMKHPSYISWRTEHAHISQLLAAADAPQLASLAGPRLVKRCR